MLFNCEIIQCVSSATKFFGWHLLFGSALDTIRVSSHSKVPVIFRCATIRKNVNIRHQIFRRLLPCLNHINTSSCLERLYWLTSTFLAHTFMGNNAVVAVRKEVFGEVHMVSIDAEFLLFLRRLLFRDFAKYRFALIDTPKWASSRSMSWLTINVI